MPGVAADSTPGECPRSSAFPQLDLDDFHSATSQNATDLRYDSFLLDYLPSRSTQTMSTILRPIKWFYHEFGIVSIHETGRNAYFIILARTCRMFAYGTNSLILGMSSS